MSRLRSKLGDMARSGSAQRPVSAGVSYPVRRSAAARRRPIPVLDLPVRERIFCKTCKDQGCIGRCRF